MSSHKKNKDPIWVYPKENEQFKKTIIDEFHIHPITAQFFISRDFTSLEAIHQFLYAKLPNLIAPELFPEMDAAIDRIMHALDHNEKVLIYGDNDVDGMSSVALLVDFLKAIGLEVFYYVPNRSTLQRSIIIDALDYALCKKCTLIITVDCGITAAKEIEEVKKKNVDVIITDHHEPTSKIPHCVATLNPKLFENSYPNRELTGVGVAFKLAHALLNHLTKKKLLKEISIDLKDYLDLVALGTISDMGALQGENRILVRYGLIEINRTKRIGLAKLFEVCGLKIGEINTFDVASKVAPRLNSLGRIADPKKGIELILIKDESQAEELAKELDLFNIERQQIEKKASDEIDLYLSKHPEVFEDKAICLHSANWHPGIIAIISARLSKQYNRPAVIISIEKGVGKGSMRTIPEYPLLPILKENASLFLNYGGHDFAAGLTIEEKNIPLFKKNLVNDANAQLLDNDVTSKLYLDGNIQFSDLTFDLMESLKLLEPYGNENPSPLFYTEVEQTWPPKIVGRLHLKMFFKQEGRTLEGIAFGFARRREELKKKNLKLLIAFTPHINTFLNKTSIQLQIREFKIL